MYKRNRHLQLTVLALGILTIATLAIAGGSSLIRRTHTASPRATELTTEASGTGSGSAAALPIEPALTNLAKQVKACPDFMGNNLPGQTLTVSLNLPTQLGGTGQCDAAPRRTIRDTISGSTIRTRRGVARPRPTPARGRPGGVTVATGTVVGSGRPRPAISPSGVDIPCELLPGGCLPPIETGGTPGTPATQLDIKGINVKWGLFESVNGRRGRALVPGRDYASPSEGLSTSFVMAPLHFAELTRSAPPTNPFIIVATVTVSAEKTILSVPPSTSDVTSEAIPIEVPLSLSALEVPKVFVLFLDTDFGGAAAIYLRKNSTLTEELLKDNVQRLADTYNPLASRLNFVTWFGTYLTGLQTLQHTFALPHWDLKELKDQESNLNDDDFIHRSALTSANDTEVEDEASSMLLIGLPDSSVQCFQDSGFSGMRFTAKTGTEMVVLIPNMISMTSQPAGRVFSKTFTNSKTPNNSLSSFKWLN